MGLPASRPRSGPSPHPRSAAAAAALSRPAGLATRLCHRHRPRWTWPAPAVLCGRSDPPQPGAPPIGAPEPAITSTSSACSGQGGVGGAGSSSRGHRPRARATTSRPLRWTGPSRLQPAQTPRRGPFSSRFVPSSACPASVGTLERVDARIRAPHPTRQMGGLLAKALMAAYLAPTAPDPGHGPHGARGVP